MILAFEHDRALDALVDLFESEVEHDLQMANVKAFYQARELKAKKQMTAKRFFDDFGGTIILALFLAPIVVVTWAWAFHLVRGLFQ